MKSLFWTLLTVAAADLVDYQTYQTYVSSFKDIQSDAKCNTLGSKSECSKFNNGGVTSSTCAHAWSEVGEKKTNYLACFPGEFCGSGMYHKDDDGTLTYIEF